MRSRPRRPLALLLAPLLLATGVACGGSDVPEVAAGADGSNGAGGDDHGEVAGAAELDEPALGLTTIDPAGEVRHLDLLDETQSELAQVGPTSALHTDGRYLFAQTAAGVAVVDSGVWTWDHVDHFHYYRAEPRDVGVLEGSGPATVATTTSSTSGGTGVLFTETGEATVLDTEALSEGELEPRLEVRLEPHDGLVVPVGEHVLATERGVDGRAAAVTALDDDGAPVPGTREPCPDARGTLTTRVGAVIGCADGALLAVADGEELTVERVPYPEGATAPPATAFAGRDGRPTVAALAGPRAVWLLDTRQRSWSLLRSPVPLAQVTAVDDDEEHVLGLTTDGRVAVLDGESGELLSTSRPLAPRSVREDPGAPVLVVDQQRAYLSAPRERRLHEIDFADGARVSRTFSTPTVPAFVAGTGR